MLLQLNLSIQRRFAGQYLHFAENRDCNKNFPKKRNFLFYGINYAAYLKYDILCDIKSERYPQI